MKRPLSEITPCETLFEDFMKPMGIFVCYLVNSIDVSSSQMSKIKHDIHSISTETALSLVVFFSMEARF